MADRKTIETSLAPAAIGPYSQAVDVDGWIWVSGQIGMDPGTGQMVEGGIAEQAHRALSNLKAVVEAADCTLDDVVKTTVYLLDMADYPAVNEVYARYFTTSHPARAAVAVKSLPRDALVEIDAVARR